LIDGEETFIDGRFAAAKKRGPAVGKTKGSKLMAMTVSLYVNNLLINKLSYKMVVPYDVTEKDGK